MRLLPSCLVLLVAGCAGQEYRQPAPNPFSEIRKVAVAPFLNLTAEKMDGREQADAFASELLMHSGFSVCRPAEVERAAKDLGLTLATAEDYLKVGRHLGADAVVVAGITEYRTYFPPRVTVALQLLVTQRPKSHAKDLEAQIRSARPISLELATAPHLNQQLERVFDGGDDNVQRAAKSYAAARVEDESPWKDGEGVLRERKRYFRFVCALLADGIIEVEQKRLEALKPKWHDPQ